MVQFSTVRCASKVLEPATVQFQFLNAQIQTNHKCYLNKKVHFYKHTPK